MDTRQQSLIELNKQMEEMRLLQTRQNDEQRQRTDALVADLRSDTKSLISDLRSDIRSELESVMARYFSTGESHKRPQEPYSSPSKVVSATPGSSRPPDPPDFNRSDLNPTTKVVPETHKASLLPNGMVTRLSKIEFPKFDGTLLREWLYRCEQFFMLDSTPPELKVRLASLHMEGKALQWHHNLISNSYGIFPSWPEYVIAVSARFGALYDDPLSELVSLKQSGDSVEMYLEKFECALTRLSLPVPHALSIFLTNMNPHLALHARQFDVTTVADAARIAKLHESSLQYTPTKPSRAPFNPYQELNPQPHYKNPNTIPLLPSPHITNTPPYKPNTTSNTSAEKYPRKLSYEEMQERRTKGLCMICEEPYTPGHHLKHKRSQFFMLECEDDKVSDDKDVIELADESMEESPTISVNALNGSFAFNCMRMVGRYGKRKLHILIDPGSTHNFLDLNVAKALGCLLELVKPVPVEAANGNRVLSSYKCSDFSWKLHGHSFSTEVRTLPLNCCDLVLGVQWLITLGPIWWDFSNLKMEFDLGGVKHVLRGVTKTNGKIIKGASLNKLWLQEPPITLLHVTEATHNKMDYSFLEPEDSYVDDNFINHALYEDHDLTFHGMQHDIISSKESPFLREFGKSYIEQTLSYHPGRISSTDGDNNLQKMDELTTQAQSKYLHDWKVHPPDQA